jgi:hypothetical protein
MLLPDDLAGPILAYFGRLLGRPLDDRESLVALPACEILRLADLLPDGFLPALVGMLKGGGPGIFEKLLGDHEESNRDASERFFRRYMEMVLEPPEQGKDFNPLEAWLPPEACQDFAFLASRESFFLRQEIAHINAWIGPNFGLGPFPPGAQEEAWNALWTRITST